MIKSHLNFSLVVFLAIAAVSCNNNSVFSKYETFEENEWPTKVKPKFVINMTDTVNLHNIFLMVRHADSYPYSNLFLFVTTKYPNGRVLNDTMELVLASQKGKWLGDGAGDIFDYRVALKKNVKFVQGGNYEFTFEQGMRVDPLPLIMDFGMAIEKSE